MSIQKKSNERLIKLIVYLKKKSHENKAPIWKDVAKRLEKPQQSWAEVNIRRVAKYTKKGDTVLVPGKLLGSGELLVPVTVAAYSFSESARDKIRSSGGHSISIPELIRRNPKGTGIRIIG
ncbi:MAG: 50S ribosomal protein L18e [Methanomassiliicoccales archaeon]|nr:MAG: 50S ribosomal protein L18e [Methanomassiliicoccales archaeon]